MLSDRLAAVIPTEAALAPQTRSITLREAEEFLEAMLDTEGVCPPERAAEFRLALADAVAVATNKREAVGRFILQTESDAKFAREEAQRATRRARVLENVAERVRQYVCDWITGQPEKTKLKGHTLTMSARACPDALEYDALLVPFELHTSTITLPFYLWSALLDMAKRTDAVQEAVYPGAIRVLTEAALAAKIAVDEKAIRAKLERGEEVPGARLQKDRFTLQVR